MRICIVGPKASRLDEAMANWTHFLWEGLTARGHDCIQIRTNPPYLGDARQLARFVRFRPDILHYVPGPSTLSLFGLRLLRFLYPRPAVVVSATQPRVGALARILPALFRPHAILALSSRGARLLDPLGCRTIVVPGGVDTGGFSPVTAREKLALRTKYGVDPHTFVALHVGPIKPGRNVLALREVQQVRGVQVLLVGSPPAPQHEWILSAMRDAGCLVRTGFSPRIGEIYALADCYLFPVISAGNAVELPLSVLEAMSVNLPVVSTSFGALPDLFAEGSGLSYANGGHAMAEAVERLRSNGANVSTRSLVLSLDWRHVVSRVEQVYVEVAGQRRRKVRS